MQQCTSCKTAAGRPVGRPVGRPAGAPGGGRRIGTWQSGGGLV